MYFKYPSKAIDYDTEIRAYRTDCFAIGGMVSDQGVEVNEEGRKVVPIGSLVDKDGKVCKVSGGSIEGTPIGITRHGVDVTNGPEAVAIYIRGHLLGPLLNIGEEEYSDEIGTAIETALPEIHIYPKPPKGE